MVKRANAGTSGSDASRDHQSPSGSGAGRSTESPGPRIKRTRVRTGCLQCKRRRVRCDENGRPDLAPNGVGGSCNACQRLDLECRWEEPNTEPKRIKRKSGPGRTSGICVVCQLTRKQCDGWIPKCSSCLETLAECVYGIIEDEEPVSEVHTERRGTIDISLDHGPNLSEMYGFDPRPFINVFFDEVHPCTILNFIHPPAFMQEFNQSRAPRHLVLAMCSMSARFMPLQSALQSLEWCAEARTICHHDIGEGRLTTSTLACLILCFHQELYQRDFATAWMTSGTAIRLALALRLNRPKQGANMTLTNGEETRRRLMWAVYMIDMYVSDGFPEYASMSRPPSELSLPCDEYAYTSGELYDAGPLILPGLEQSYNSVSTSMRTLANPTAQYIAVFTIRTRILFYARTKAEGSPPWNMNSLAQRCRTALESWKAGLPTGLDMEQDDSWKQMSHATISTLMGMHLWYSISYCDLGRLMITSFTEAASPEVLANAPDAYVQNAQGQSVEYAMKVFELCNLVLDKVPTFIPHDPHASVIFFQALRILLWDLHRQGRPSVLIKRYTVDSCQSALVLLYRMAPLFPYAQIVLLDMLSLLTRYNMSETLFSRLPQDLATPFRLLDLSARRRNPALSSALNEPVLNRSNSDEPIEPGLSPDQGQSDLLRPPFHSRIDPPPSSRTDASPTARSTGGSGAAATQVAKQAFPDVPFDQSRLQMQAGDLDLLHSLGDDQNWISDLFNNQTRTVTRQMVEEGASAFPGDTSRQYNGVGWTGDQDIWSALFNDSDTARVENSQTVPTWLSGNWFDKT